ncbi:FtsW/RodA/SpoVE family cell cycle protein [Bacillus sp. JJ1122]|uniref:FtsW/RodA/SpoVE family cell cycle protein n=1 Tax=Bacillus sp. JJ1122 TaxID=3122951 RepID=UPI002FFEE657
MNERKARFLNEVKNHISSKEAKEFVSFELEYHLMQVKKDWIGKGLSETDAEEKAVIQMGSPAKLGQELNKLHRPRVDWWMIGLLAITMGLSFLPLFALRDMLDDSYILHKIAHVILGSIAAVGMKLIDYRKLEKKGWLFYMGGVMLLLLITYFPNLIINGVAYFKIGSIELGSMMALPFLFLSWASFFNNPRIKIWQHSILFMIPVLLFMEVPNLSAVFIYTIMVFTMMWWSRIGKRTAMRITAVLLILIAAFIAMALSTAKEYQLARIFGFLNPEKYPDSWGYMYLMLKERFLTAGWFGPSAKSESLPFEHTDYVFVSLTYHYGYVFAIGLLLVLTLFAARILFISNKISNQYGILLLVGGLALYLIQFVYNVGMVAGLLPLTSMSLPFISYGLMPTIFNAFIMGVVLSVYRRKDLTTSRVEG